MDAVIGRIRDRMPPELHQGFRLLCQGKAREREKLVTPVARWFERVGGKFGFRAPNVVERARATARGAYLLHLGLKGRALYDLCRQSFRP